MEGDHEPEGGNVTSKVRLERKKELRSERRILLSQVPRIWRSLPPDPGTLGLSASPRIPPVGVLLMIHVSPSPSLRPGIGCLGWQLDSLLPQHNRSNPLKTNGRRAFGAEVASKSSPSRATHKAAWMGTCLKMYINTLYVILDSLPVGLCWPQQSCPLKNNSNGKPRSRPKLDTRH